MLDYLLATSVATTIASMRAFSTDRKTFLAITWLLTGVLFIGCLVHSLPAMQEIAICAEDRALELDGEDDDRDKVRCLQFAHFGCGPHSPLPQTWRSSPVVYSVQDSQSHWRSHSERAPPHC
jgi:hypothetical protein